MELFACRRIVLFTIFVTTAVVHCSNIGATRQDITLDSDGGFIDILIAIHDDVAEDRDILSSIEVGTKVWIHIKQFQGINHCQYCIPSCRRKSWTFSQTSIALCWLLIRFQQEALKKEIVIIKIWCWYFSVSRYWPCVHTCSMLQLAFCFLSD